MEVNLKKKLLYFSIVINKEEKIRKACLVSMIILLSTFIFAKSKVEINNFDIKIKENYLINTYYMTYGAYDWKPDSIKFKINIINIETNKKSSYSHKINGNTTYPNDIESENIKFLNNYIIINRKNNSWHVDSGDIYLFNIEKGKFSRYSYSFSRFLREFYVDKQNKIYFIFDNGYLCHDILNNFKEVKKIFWDLEDAKDFQNNLIEVDPDLTRGDQILSPLIINNKLLLFYKNIDNKTNEIIYYNLEEDKISWRNEINIELPYQDKEELFGGNFIIKDTIAIVHYERKSKNYNGLKAIYFRVYNLNNGQYREERVVDVPEQAYYRIVDTFAIIDCRSDEKTYGTPKDVSLWENRFLLINIFDTNKIIDITDFYSDNYSEHSEYSPTYESQYYSIYDVYIHNDYIILPMKDCIRVFDAKQNKIITKITYSGEMEFYINDKYLLFAKSEQLSLGSKLKNPGLSIINMDKLTSIDNWEIAEDYIDGVKYYKFLIEDNKYYSLIDSLREILINTRR